MSALPNCLVIGAMKAGTTSMHNYLNAHPDVFASVEKEINFFLKERNWDKGIEWYKNQFEATYKIRVESSQNYSKRHLFENVPKRIKETLGNDVKFIYIVRNPIKRIQSHFLERLTAGHVEKNIRLKDALYKFMEEFPLEKNHMVQTSMYHYQLEPYIELFGKDKIYIARSENIYKDTLGEMNKIFSFLGLKELNDPKLFKKQFNCSKDKYYDPEWLKSVYSFMCCFYGGGRVVKQLKKLSVFRKKIKTDHSELDDWMKNKIEKIFETKEKNDVFSIF